MRRRGTVTVERPKGWLTDEEWAALPSEMRDLFVATDESTFWYKPDDHFEAFGVDVSWVEHMRSLLDADEFLDRYTTKPVTGGGFPFYAAVPLALLLPGLAFLGWWLFH